MQRHQLYRCSRSTEITCLTFGANRKEDFPDHFFCHGCDLVEDAVMTSMNRHPNRNSKRYRCTGGHTDLTKPTTLKKLYRPSNVRPERPAGSSLSFKSNRNRNDVAAEEMSITTSDTRETTSSSVTNNVQGSECNFDELGRFAESIHDNGIMTPAPHRDVLSCDPRRLFTAADSFSTLAAPSYTPAPPADGAQSDKKNQKSILRVAALPKIRSSRPTRFSTTTGAVAPNKLVIFVPNRSTRHIQQNLNTGILAVDDDRVGG